MNFLAEERDPLRAVLHGKRFFKDVAKAVTAEGDVFAFGVIEGDAEHLAGRGGFLENGSDFDALTTVDGFCWIGFMFVHGHTRLKINLE